MFISLSKLGVCTAESVFENNIVEAKAKAKAKVKAKRFKVKVKASEL